MTHRQRPLYLLLILSVLLPAVARAEDAKATAVPAPAPVQYVEETLDNGLRVIYAPLHQAPVVHMRVLYHVGSRDERPDRQGFAHMFEHMMFRGSAHVKPEEHMKLIGTVGGISNAFTSFDQTVYVNTIPANHTEMALYLEADRMSSFKVNETIYKTERKVVGEEWRIRQNRPYGTLGEDLAAAMFTAHSYRWTPIGNMQHLAQAQVAELQDFFNTYYVPNNAVLVITGDIDVETTKQWVRKYYAWIPRGGDVPRNIPAEPEQTKPVEKTVQYRVPLPRVTVGWKLPAYRADDHYALALLATVLGGGDSSRLDRLLVHGDKPLAVNAGAGHNQREDSGVFSVSATLLAGKSADEVEAALRGAVAEVVEKGVTADELAKAKTMQQVRIINGRQTCTNLANELGEEALFGGDARRVNTLFARLGAVTTNEARAVAKKYLTPQRATTLRVEPDPTGTAARPQAAEAASARVSADAPAAAAPTRAARARDVRFPPGYPTGPMMGKDMARPEFQKGQESTVNGVTVIVMPDHRLPLVDWSLTMRRGSHSDPKGKEGLASLTGDMLRRGAGNFSYDALNLELESRGISLDVSSGGDTSAVGGGCTTPQLGRGIELTKLVLTEPTFPEDEFRKLKERAVNSLSLSREDARTVAGWELDEALYGGSPLGAVATPRSVQSVTLDDVTQFYRTYFKPHGAILMISGDVTVERGRELAKQLLAGWADRQSDEPPQVAYDLPPATQKRTIVLVDRPAGQQAVIRMGVRAYDVRSEEKYAGALAGAILSSGIESRLGRYVRAEKGYAYGVTGRFGPNRHAGAFVGTTDTALESTGAAIEAMFKVFDDMRREEVTPVELAEAKTRVAGSFVMGLQTIAQQASYRVGGILDGFPIDYYDRYPERVGQVTAAQVRDVVGRYVKDGAMVIVVVAPAEQVKSQLDRLGEVQVLPMPAKREGADGNAVLKKAA
jgi:zinc protease